MYCYDTQWLIVALVCLASKREIDIIIGGGLPAQVWSWGVNMLFNNLSCTI